MSTEEEQTKPVVAPAEFTEEERTEARKKVANVPINVLENTIKILEAAIQRNAFNRPDEMTFVGTNYDTLKGGLKMALEMTRKEMVEAVETEDKKLETIDEEDSDLNDLPELVAEVENIPVVEVVPVEIKEVSEEPSTEFKVTSSLGF
jgi:RNA processing factor Prp31